MSGVQLDATIAAPDIGPEEQAIAADRRAMMLKATRELPLVFRQAALLTLKGLTPAEAAQVLGISTNAVGIRMARAKVLLRDLLGDRPRSTLRIHSGMNSASSGVRSSRMRALLPSILKRACAVNRAG